MSMPIAQPTGRSRAVVAHLSFSAFPGSYSPMDRGEGGGATWRGRTRVRRPRTAAGAAALSRTDTKITAGGVTAATAFAGATTATAKTSIQGDLRGSAARLLQVAGELRHRRTAVGCGEGEGNGDRYGGEGVRTGVRIAGSGCGQSSVWKRPLRATLDHQAKEGQSRK